MNWWTSWFCGSHSSKTLIATFWARMSLQLVVDLGLMLQHVLADFWRYKGQKPTARSKKTYCQLVPDGRAQLKARCMQKTTCVQHKLVTWSPSGLLQPGKIPFWSPPGSQFVCACLGGPRRRIQIQSRDPGENWIVGRPGSKAGLFNGKCKPDC